MDVLSVRERIPMDKDAYTYELGLITAIERIKKDALPKLKCEIPEDDIVDVIRGKQTNVNADFIPFIESGLSSMQKKWKQSFVRLRLICFMKISCMLAVVLV